METLTKQQSTDGYKNGRFGNHLRQWDTPEEALAECSGDMMIRHRDSGAQGPAVTTAAEHNFLGSEKVLISC